MRNICMALAKGYYFRNKTTHHKTLNRNIGWEFIAFNTFYISKRFSAKSVWQSLEVTDPDVKGLNNFSNSLDVILHL
jgi:hypothetical protein